MATKMNDERGCSVCAAGSENFEFFTTRLGRKVYHRMQYDYRHTDGELFSCIGNDLESCRKRRDEWLSKKKGWTGKGFNTLQRITIIRNATFHNREANGESIPFVKAINR